MSVRSVTREIAYNIGKVAYKTETTRSIFKFGAKVCRKVGPHLISDYQTGDVIVRLEMARHSTYPPQLPVHCYEAPDQDLKPVIINLKNDRVETSEKPTMLAGLIISGLPLEERQKIQSLAQQATIELKSASPDKLGQCANKWARVLGEIIPPEEANRIESIAAKMHAILKEGFQGKRFDQEGLEDLITEWQELGIFDGGHLATIAAMSTAFILFRSNSHVLSIELGKSAAQAEDRKLALELKAFFERQPQAGGNVDRELGRFLSGTR